MKLLTIIVAAIAVAALGVGGTWAAFNNTQPSTGNTFQAGNFDVFIGGRNNQGNAVAGPYFTVTNMKPGDTATVYVEVKNANNGMDALLRIYLDNVVQSPGSFSNQLQATVTLHPEPYSPMSFSGTRYGPANLLVYSGPLNGIIGTNTPINNLDLAFNQGQPFPPEYQAAFKIEVSLPLASGNAYQGATLTGTIVVGSTQFAGQNPASIVW